MDFRTDFSFNDSLVYISQLQRSIYRGVRAGTNLVVFENYKAHKTPVLIQCST